ncbi:MAG TPA: hypothetical protein VGQ34_02300 [Sphingomicrobium sp.]|jgi:hypothetical protein|nr:hypothetical protein [Sphingomicrobium sp.]
MKSKRDKSYVELGRISTETKGAVFGTIEQVGLYQPASILR